MGALEMAWGLRALAALVVPRFGSQHPHWADASDLCGQLHLSAHTHEYIHTYK